MTDSIICSHHRIRALLLMCVVFLAACPSAQAQNQETRLNLNIRNATLESFVKTLENATGFSFVYGEEVKLKRRITLEAKQQTISEILQRAFENEPVRFEISGKHILLHRKALPQKPVNRKFTISGYVTDGASAETLIGANVLESRRSTGTATNPFGFYTVTMPEGEAEVVFSYLGYESQRHKLSLDKDTLLNVSLTGNTQLAEVVVLSDKREAGIESTAMGSHEIPMAQIRHTPTILGEADLLKTIQLMPGVQAGMEGFAGMYVRGGSPDQNLVMLDGIPVYNADHLLGVFSIFTPEAVKNTTLFKSSFPARYGGRLSSIVDIRTNDGDMHRYHGALSIGILTDKLHFEGPLWKGKTSFSLSARVVPTVFIPKGIGMGSDTYTSSGYHYRNSDKGNYYFYDLNAKLNHKFDDRNRLFLSFYKGKDLYMIKSESQTTYDSNAAYLSTDKDDSRLSWGNTIAYARWNHVFSNRLFGNITLSSNLYDMKLKSDMEETRILNNEVRDRYSYNARFVSGIRDWSARADFDYTPIPQHHIKFGTEYIHHTFRPGVSTSKMQDIDDGTVLEDTLYNTSSNRTMYGQELSLYAEDNFNATDRLSLNAGLRAALFHTQGKSYYSLQPRLSARYDLGRGFSTKASYTCMAQYVHLLTSTPLSMPTDLWVPITKDIRPMYANQYSVGSYYSGIPGWEFSIESYYKQMRHILEYQDGVSFFGTSTNWEEKVESGEGRSFGLELMAQKTMGKTTGWLAYTLSRTDHRFKNGNINQGRWFPYKYDRRHNLSLCVNHKFSDRIDVGASWIFNSGGCITIPEKATIIITPNGRLEETGYISSRNNYRLPSSHRLNIGVNFNKKTKHGMRTWNISVYNAYNAMNPNIVYSKYENGSYFYQPTEDDNYIEHRTEGKTTIKKLTILPCIPSVTYTYRF
ncbi:MAG: TonB-dependent receptor [Bacteroides sp.]|nr:TonB-dependent receptor [Bacteroides sp.]